MSSALPEPGDTFKIRGRRHTFHCLDVRDGDVLAYGGSPNPWGQKGVRSFALDAEFVVTKKGEQHA